MIRLFYGPTSGIKSLGIILGCLRLFLGEKIVFFGEKSDLVTVHQNFFEFEKKKISSLRNIFSSLKHIFFEFEKNFEFETSYRVRFLVYIEFETNFWCLSSLRQTFRVRVSLSIEFGSLLIELG